MRYFNEDYLILLQELLLSGKDLLEEVPVNIDFWGESRTGLIEIEKI